MAVAARQTKPDGVSTEVRRAFEQLTAGYKKEPNPSYEARLDRLERLEKMIVSAREDIVSACDADFGGRARHEAQLVEVVLTLEGLRDTRRHLRKWMRQRRAPVHPLYVRSRAWVEPIPKGVVAILSPWNYPVNLALVPAASALAAGCRVLLKPSELTPRTSAVMARAVREHFSAEEMAVLEGGPEVAQVVTSLPWDHLLFTGSGRVGKLVARAASEHLVPLTLELGGKCPALVMPDYPVGKAAALLAPAKVFNGGQTCIAPDYALVPEEKVDVFVDAFVSAVREGWPNLPGDPGYTAQITDGAFARLQALIADATQKGAKVVPVAPAPVGRKLAPVVVLGATAEMRVMQEELFGPIFPVIGYRDLAHAEEWIARNPRPLALYIFDQNEERARQTIARIPSGGACINEALAHFAQDALPFGGLGPSGMGAYHGKAGFLTFSHERSVLSAHPLSPGRHATGPYAAGVLDRATDLIGHKLTAWVMDKLHKAQQ